MRTASYPHKICPTESSGHFSKPTCFTMLQRGFMLGILLLTVLPLKSQEEKEASTLWQIGLCSSISDVSAARESGYRYLEPSVGNYLMPQEPEIKFLEQLKKIKALKYPVYACNSFIPGEIKTVGPEVDKEKIMNYVTIALKRANMAGIKIIVFGSGASRKIPDGFSKEQATQQFIELLKDIAPIAKKNKVIIAIEPLNRTETNFINSVAEGMEIVSAVDRKQIRILADIYHMKMENEFPDELLRTKGYLVHVHVAEKQERAAPGTYKEDFSAYLTKLKEMNYTGTISVECRWKDKSAEMPSALTFINEEMKKIK